MSLAIIWYALSGHHPDDVKERRERHPWLLTKTTPSFADMLAKLRRVIIASQFHPRRGCAPTPPRNHERPASVGVRRTMNCKSRGIKRLQGIPHPRLAFCQPIRRDRQSARLSRGFDALPRAPRCPYPAHDPALFRHGCGDEYAGHPNDRDPSSLATTMETCSERTAAFSVKTRTSGARPASDALRLSLGNATGGVLKTAP
jgi:hypothetical protein